MLTSMTIKNFRSIESATLRLAPITVFYGPTASGKSSVLYSILALRNFVLNPNRPADGFLHLGFMDLGGFDACVFDHDGKRSIGLSVAYGNKQDRSSFGLSLSKTAGEISLNVGAMALKATVNIPYAMNQTFRSVHVEGDEEFAINWNGIVATLVSPKREAAETQQRARELTTALNAPAESLKGIDVAPHKRGFFKPNYTPVSVSLTPSSEDEVASIIINDQHMAGRISTYVEEIFGRDFRIHIPPGTATAFLQTTDKKARVTNNLINDGFGVNQVIYLLAKMYRPEVHTVLIEEPEVHLHPTVVRRFVRALCTFAREEDKQILLTTHSEQFLSSLLTAVSEGAAGPSDIGCFLTLKEKRATTFNPQKINETGQIEGGLSSFIEAEIEDLKKFLKVP